MLFRIFIIVIVLCTSCRTGIIPCPDTKGPKFRKYTGKYRIKTYDRHYARKNKSTPVYTAQSQNVIFTQDFDVRPIDLHHVDVDNLDCPKPGEKKLPKEVKDNLKKNRKKIRSQFRNSAAASESQTTAPSY